MKTKAVLLIENDDQILVCSEKHLPEELDVPADKDPIDVCLEHAVELGCEVTREAIVFNGQFASEKEQTAFYRTNHSPTELKAGSEWAKEDAIDWPTEWLSFVKDNELTGDFDAPILDNKLGEFEIIIG